MTAIGRSRSGISTSRPFTDRSTRDRSVARGRRGVEIAWDPWHEDSCEPRRDPPRRHPEALAPRFHRDPAARRRRASKTSPSSRVVRAGRGRDTQHVARKDHCSRDMRRRRLRGTPKIRSGHALKEFERPSRDHPAFFDSAFFSARTAACSLRIPRSRRSTWLVNGPATGATSPRPSGAETRRLRRRPRAVAKETRGP